MLGDDILERLLDQNAFCITNINDVLSIIFEKGKFRIDRTRKERLNEFGLEVYAKSAAIFNVVGGVEHILRYDDEIVRQELTMIGVELHVMLTANQ